MDIFSLSALGLVQGLTEFLPVSSSGHLIIARDLLGVQGTDGLAVDAVLQLATALALLVYFRHDFLALLRDAFRWMGQQEVLYSQKVLILAIILGTIPAGIAGLLLEHSMETTFRSAELVAYTLLVGSFLMLLAEWVSRSRKETVLAENKNLTVWKGIGVGFFQCLALVPGISRSGATISGGLLLGLPREDAARFGFLLSFPIIFLSGMKKLLELMQSNEIHTLGVPLLVGSVVAFGVGLLAIHYLLRYLKTHTLGIFIVYRTVLAVTVLIALNI